MPEITVWCIDFFLIYILILGNFVWDLIICSLRASHFSWWGINCLFHVRPPNSLIWPNDFTDFPFYPSVSPFIILLHHIYTVKI